MTLENFRVLNLAPFPFFAVLITSEEEWNNLAPELQATHDHWLNECTACVRDCGHFSVVSINPTGKLTSLVDTLAHEATHVFQHMCQHISEYDPSKEMEAYYIGHITSWLFQQTFDEFMENAEDE